jgi:hypothetical protein
MYETENHMLKDFLLGIGTLPDGQENYTRDFQGSNIP